MRQAFFIDKDIAGDGYASLLKGAIATFARFSLVWRDQLAFAKSAKQVRKDLKPLEISMRRTNKWPGTEILDSQADFVIYQFGAGADEVLSRPKSLFNWLAPAYPEDLAFYDDDGRCCFLSITHEKEAWVLDSDFGRLLSQHVKMDAKQLDDLAFDDCHI
jgi:hypothetical protein